MYEERGEDGKRRYTVAQIAAEFGVGRPTIYRYSTVRPSMLTWPRHDPAPPIRRDRRGRIRGRWAGTRRGCRCRTGRSVAPRTGRGAAAEGEQAQQLAVGARLLDRGFQLGHRLGPGRGHWVGRGRRVAVVDVPAREGQRGAEPAACGDLAGGGQVQRDPGRVQHRLLGVPVQLLERFPDGQAAALRASGGLPHLFDRGPAVRADRGRGEAEFVRCWCCTCFSPPGLHQHPPATTGPGRSGVGKEADPRGPAGTERAVLDQRQPLRQIPAGHGHPPRSRPGGIAEYHDPRRTRTAAPGFDLAFVDCRPGQVPPLMTTCWPTSR